MTFETSCKVQGFTKSMLESQARFKNCWTNIFWSSKNHENCNKTLDVKQESYFEGASFSYQERH